MNEKKRQPDLIQLGIVVLTLVTAGIHLTLLFPDVLFILNGLGYLSLLAALFLRIPFVQRYRRITKFGLLGFTLLTIILYFVMNDTFATLGLVTKSIEVLLILLLLGYRPSPAK